MVKIPFFFALIARGSFRNQLEHVLLVLPGLCKYHPEMIKLWDNHMFMQELDPVDAPLVIWLQGGPGSSSMFGLFEIHGPISAVFENGQTAGTVNPHSWHKRANMVYIDNPVGAGNRARGISQL
jgi:hypothetical protein